MSTPCRASKPWPLSWAHMALALAVGAGLPLLWLWFSPPAKPMVVAQADAQGLPVALGGPGPVAAARVASPAEPTTPLPAPSIAAPLPVPARMAAPQIPRLRDPNGDQSPDITDFINQGEVPTMAEVISRLHAAGERGGLAAFNPPGTRPPLVGIAVSADAELPPGYVRHHQFTDDGQRIEPILMFAPDHPLVVAAGPGAAQPQDRVVPPALVPPGLPVRQIVVPAPVEHGPGLRK